VPAWSCRTSTYRWLNGTTQNNESEILSTRWAHWGSGTATGTHAELLAAAAHVLGPAAAIPGLVLPFARAAAAAGVSDPTLIVWTNSVARDRSVLGCVAMMQHEVVSVGIREERHVANTGVERLAEERDALSYLPRQNSCRGK
jgi:hypothetical protein